MQNPSVLATHLRQATRFLIYTMGFLMPLFFLSSTIDPLEVNKQTLFVLLTLLAALLWIGSMMLERAITVRRGWVNLLPILLAAAFIIPSIYSLAPYLSWIGTNNQQYTSAITMLTGALLFFVMTNTLTERAAHKTMHTVLLVSATLTAILGLSSLLGWFTFPGALSTITAFNTVGTLNALAVFLTIITVFSLATWISHTPNDSLLHSGTLGKIEHLLTPLLTLLTLLTLLALDYSTTWLVFIIGLLILFTFVFFRSGVFKTQKRLILPAILLIAALFFWLALPSPLTIQIPAEVSLSQSSSLDIASNALAFYSPSYGSGPGTYLFDYAQFHGVEINETSFWGARFDRGSSHVLTLLPTIGYVGLTALTAFVLLLLARGLKQVFKPSSRDEWLESFIHLSPWLTLIAAAFLYPYNMTLTFSFLFFSGLIGSQMMGRIAKKSFEKSPKLGFVFSGTFLLGSLAFLVGIFMTSQMYAAEAAFANAVRLDRNGGEIQEIVQELDRAATLNRFDDTYYRNLSEALLISLGAQLDQVEGVSALTANSQQYIQSLIAASVNASVRATELSSYNVQNWLSRGAVYRELSAIQSTAASFAIESYARAVELEPLNPSHWTEFGKAYLIAAEVVRPLTVAEDDAVAAEAAAELDRYLSSAEAAFLRATELKSNYASAHYQLGIAYERQGRLDDAIVKLENVAAYNPLDVGVQFELGVLYLQRGGAGDTDRAQVAFEQAVTLAPSYSNARWFLATVYEMQDEVLLAVQEVEAVLALNPDNAVVESRLNRLLRGEVETEVPEAIEE